MSIEDKIKIIEGAIQKASLINSIDNRIKIIKWKRCIKNLSK